MSEKERDAIFAKWNSKKLVAHVGNEPQRSKTKTMSPLKPSRLQAPAPRAVSAPTPTGGGTGDRSLEWEPARRGRGLERTGGVGVPVQPPVRGTPQEWGDSMEPEGAGEAGWGRGEEEGAGEHPSILRPPRFQVLTPSRGLRGLRRGNFCTGMDLELVSPLPYPDWVPDGLAESLGDILKTPEAGDLGDLGGGNAL
ncbi:hypothetical protein AAFF_G00040940 [Aldrovandia affinis]|uniref:Uncharacterized protein n=1 Tax=Aldrovandia affinis TaxID=143900 RepID=A0AAD7VXZ0_9TELE|nr:hypothetical protein AAFF_G00040940 [Aldrovandia affinis]